MALRPVDTTHFTLKGSNWVFDPKQSTFLRAYPTNTNAELAAQFGASESVVETFIRGLKEKGILPKGKKIRADDLAAYKEELQKLKKWAKNPTFENWSKYFGKVASGARGDIQRNIRAYFSGDPIPAPSKKILDSLEIKKEIPKNAQNVLKTFTIDFFRKNRTMLGGTAAAIARTPLQKGTNDYAEIIKIFKKYNDNINISKLDKQDEILRLMKKNPVIVARFKEQGVPLTFKNLRTRVARTHNAVINNSLNPKRYPGIFEDLSRADRQQFLNKAMRTFDNTVFRSFRGQLVDLLKGNELNLANDKLSKFTNLKQFLADKMKYVGGKNMSLIELDHPISLSALEKSKNLHQSLRVNPIAGDINKWKLTLDKRLNLLQKKGDVKGLRALNEINQTLFGKGSPSFTVGAKGISEIKGLPADFRKANLVELLKGKVGLHDTLKENIKTIQPETWKASGVNQAAMTTRLNQLKSWDPATLTRYIDEWTTKNPKWTKILEKRIGCKTGCLAVVANENPAAFSEVLKKTPQAARSFLGFLGKGGAKAAPLVALAAVGAGVEPLVKQFVADDPTTYLTNEGQMKGMLLATIEGETPKVDEEILKWQYPGMAASAAAAIPGSSALMKARKAKGFGTPRAALGPVGKFLAGSFSPLGVAATLPISIAAQREGGTEWGDIATDPLNWLAPAFASTGAKMATRGMAPTGILSKAIRLGVSPRALSVVSRRFGLPGLAISAGMWGYDKWKNRSINDKD